MASGINSTLRQVGIATGVAALGTILASHVRASVIDGLSGTPSPATRTRSRTRSRPAARTGDRHHTGPAARPRRGNRQLRVRRGSEHHLAGQRDRLVRGGRRLVRAHPRARLRLRRRPATSTGRAGGGSMNPSTSASGGRRRRRLRRTAGRARAAPGAGRGHPGRPAELHALPAARLPGRDRRARAGRDRDAAALDPQAPGECARPARRGDAASTSSGAESCSITSRTASGRPRSATTR